MLKHYFITALSNLLRYRLFAAINLFGLATGLACTLLIGLFVRDELSYDKHFADSERIYRISRDFPKQNLELATNAPQIAPLLAADFPEIEHAARVFGGQALIRKDEIAYYENSLRLADPELLRIFDFDWLSGDPSTALSRPFTAVLTETLARKYFGNETPLGKTLLLEGKAPLEVTGVIRDLPYNTHLDISLLISMTTIVGIVGEQFLNDWSSNSFYTYIKLQPGIDIESVSAQFPAFVRRHMGDSAVDGTAMAAVALQDIHLRSARQHEMKPPGSISNVYLFSAIALFVLLIACCNFMNLATARSTRRGKEVGIRKALGASRAELASQFLGEALLMTFIALLAALLLVELVLPTFNAFLGRDLSLNLLTQPGWLLVLVGLATTVSIIAGSYPAFFLSSFKPVQVLRSILASGGSAIFRNTLVVLQFAIAIVLVIATLVVVMQMRYARNIELGFEKERVLILSGSPTAGLGPQWETLREELLRNPEILQVGASGDLPLSPNTNSVGARIAGQAQGEGRSLPFMRVDEGFFETYAIDVLAGRVFSKAYPSDRLQLESTNNGFVLNRLAVEQYDWTPEEAVGKSLWAFTNGGLHEGRVIGVVENSYFESVRTPLKPMLFMMTQPVVNGAAELPYASLRLSGRNLQDTLAFIDATWNRFNPDFPLPRRFLDEDFESLYSADEQQGQLFYYFALLAIFIACLGLYGLASFNAERRRKEVGVRKVLGGSVWRIVVLLTNDFSKLVLLANVLAWPVAYFAMQSWLSNFAYRIDLTPLVFIGSGAIALCIAWVTVGTVAARAASAKPVLALRYE